MRYLFTVIFLGVLTVQGQDFFSWQYKDRYFSGFLGTGQSTYFGELNYTNRIQDKFSHLMLGSEVRLWSQVSARVSGAYYFIKGSDDIAPDSTWQKQRNLSFGSHNLELSLQGIFFLKKYAGSYNLRWAVDPYLALGVGMTTFNPQAEFGGKTYNLRELRTENAEYGKVAFTVPAALGVKLRITPFINLNVELAYRYAFTDYLDDVSTVYADIQDDLLRQAISNRKDEVALQNQEAYDQLIPGGKRGEANNKDSYGFLSFQLEVFIPKDKGAFLKKPSAY